MSNTAVEFAHRRREAYLPELTELLRLPSISTLPEHREDVRATAAWIAERLRALGMDTVEVCETPGHPIVYAEWCGAPGKPTVLVYGHYDVQPVDPLDEWNSPPFTPTVVGDYLVARGASDMKGQLFAQLKAMEALHAEGPYAFNIKYLLEGEEEIGSPNLPGFLEANRERLACDVVLNCDSMIHGPEIPSIVYSLRGLAYFELELQGQEKDLHSGRFGGAIRNPLHVLAELIAGMHYDEGRVTLPGFYDDVAPLDEAERRLLQQSGHTDDTWCAMAGTDTLFGEEGFTTTERVGARPTLEVNGIWGGYTGEGAKTVLPARAHAKISMRLVANQQPEDMERRLRAYLDLYTPSGIRYRLETHSLGPGAAMDRHSPYMRHAQAALEAVFGKAPLFTREGGSVPVVGHMQRLLGVDSIMLGFALPDDGIHGPNERQHLPTLYRGIDTYIRFLEGIGRERA
jgi:acetylornithine deacetylase/succinyl-diaminopimelate desuccinylase-like protein